MKRHLFYYACPYEGKNARAWKWNVQRLLSYWDIFNGRKLVMIATGPDLAPAAAVKACFEGRGVEFLEVKNDPKRGETRHFLDGVVKFKTTSREEALFFAHTKGVRYGEGEVLESILRWCDAMYLCNLGSERLVDWALKRYATMGCFRQKLDLAGSKWHYSGTFFWTRLGDLFGREWSPLKEGRYGVEGYPGRIFLESESYDPTPYTHASVLYHNAPSWETVKGWFESAVRKAT